jgi:hypothetical protein
MHSDLLSDFNTFVQRTQISSKHYLIVSDLWDLFHYDGYMWLQTHQQFDQRCSASTTDRQPPELPSGAIDGQAAKDKVKKESGEGPRGVRHACGSVRWLISIYGSWTDVGRFRVLWTG